jgi:hypothetical protein
MSDTYQRQKLWNDYRQSKIDRSTTERDQKYKEELTFKPKINKTYNKKKRVQSRLLNSTNSTRQASIYQSKTTSSKSSSSNRSNNHQRNDLRNAPVPTNATNKTSNSNSNSNNSNSNSNSSSTNSNNEDQLNNSNVSVMRNEVFDLSDDEETNDPHNNSISSVSSTSGDEGEEQKQKRQQKSDDYGINPPQHFARHTSTGISLHIARQRQARLRRKEIENGKVYRTKRAALNARPFNLSTSNAHLSNNGNDAQGDPSLLNMTSSTSGDAFMGLIGQHSSGITDADIRNMIRQHRCEIQEIRQEYAAKMKASADETREMQEDALIRQEVALRRLFDEERKSWQTEKTQLMTLIGSLQNEIAERAEARTHAESMARSLSSVVGTLEKRLMQVEQGAQDEIKKLRASLVSGGAGIASGGNSKQALRNLGSGTLLCIDFNIICHCI